MNILNEDCRLTMSYLPPESIDLVVTSPPYDNQRPMSPFPFDAFTEVADGLLRVLKPGGVIVWVVNDQTKNGTESGSSFRQALHFKDIGLNLHDTMIWQKDSCAFPETTRYYPLFEYMFILSKGRPKTINLLADRKNKWANGKKRIRGHEYDRRGVLNYERKRSGNLLKEYGIRYNIWRVPTGCGKSGDSKLLGKHPAIMPESIPRDHIITWSNPGDRVFDPFMGSGTTGLAALKLGREFLGCEVDRAYYNLSKARLEGLD